MTQVRERTPAGVLSLDSQVEEGTQCPNEGTK